MDALFGKWSMGERSANAAGQVRDLLYDGRAVAALWADDGSSFARDVQKAIDEASAADLEREAAFGAWSFGHAYIAPGSLARVVDLNRNGVCITRITAAAAELFRRDLLDAVGADAPAHP